MADIPDDVITKILALLPPESLQRFKRVSKLWRATIENQHKLLLVMPGVSYSTFNFIDGDKVDEIVSTSNPIMLPPKFHKSLPIHISSCHGLVFMALEDGSMILWNPTSRKYNEIPLIDESISSSSSTRDYKIVRLKTTNSTLTLETMHEFSWKKRCWRMIRRDVLSGFDHINSNAVAYDGAFHFLAATWNWSVRRFITLLSYSLKDEMFYEISIPQEKSNILGLCLYRGRLSYLSSELINNELVRTLEVRSLVGENWEKVTSLRRLAIGDKFLVPQIMFVRNGGDFLVLSVGDAEPVVYKNDPSWNNFTRVGSHKYFPKFAKAIEYVSSSVSPTYP